MGYPHGQWRSVILGLLEERHRRRGPMPAEHVDLQLDGKKLNPIGYFDGGEGKKCLIVAAEKAREIPWYVAREHEVNFVILGEMEEPHSPSPRWELIHLSSFPREGLEYGTWLCLFGSQWRTWPCPADYAETGSPFPGQWEFSRSGHFEHALYP